jgi:Forkhead domain
MAPVDCASDDGEENDALLRERLANSLSQSFPSSTLSHILHVNQDANVDDDRLSSSCFAELCQMKTVTVNSTEDDDELTCLDWLQDINLLQSINPSTQQCSVSGQYLPSKSDMTSPGLSPDGQKENASIPAYDPMRNLTSKPPYSFSVLIFMAIEASPRRRLPVKDIYNWIAEHFPYYRRAPLGWRNSVRHNLSLNKCFRKVEKVGCLLGRLLNCTSLFNLLTLLCGNRKHYGHYLVGTNIILKYLMIKF